jgi:hypothetical protein
VENRVFKDLRVILARRAIREKLVHKENKAHRVSKEYRVPRVTKATKEMPVIHPLKARIILMASMAKTA